MPVVCFLKRKYMLVGYRNLDVSAFASLIAGELYYISGEVWYLKKLRPLINQQYPKLAHVFTVGILFSYIVRSKKGEYSLNKFVFKPITKGEYKTIRGIMSAMPLDLASDMIMVAKPTAINFDDVPDWLEYAVRKLVGNDEFGREAVIKGLPFPPSRWDGEIQLWTADEIMTCGKVDYNELLKKIKNRTG